MIEIIGIILLNFIIIEIIGHLTKEMKTFDLIGIKIFGQKNQIKIKLKMILKTTKTKVLLILKKLMNSEAIMLIKRIIMITIKNKTVKKMMNFGKEKLR